MTTMPVSVGEMADRWTIANVRVLKCRDDAGRRAALAALHELRMPDLDPAARAVCAALANVNERLWELQDRVRQLLGLGDTGPEFTEVARSIPVLGDTRAHLKRRIDALAGVDAASPAAVREKMYAPV